MQQKDYRLNKVKTKFLLKIKNMKSLNMKFNANTLNSIKLVQTKGGGKKKRPGIFKPQPIEITRG